jgi:hypothetical protein
MLDEGNENMGSDASQQYMEKGEISTITQPVLSIVKHLEIPCLIPLRQ